MNSRFKSFNLDQWLTHIQRQHWRTMDLTLDRISQVWINLDGQCTGFVVTVAGTNGKGSSISMLESVYRQAGKITGAYTSPHLVRFNERIRINGIDSPDSEICRALYQIEFARDNIPLTYFEFGTLCALLVFQKHQVDVALLEVGLGGRLDAANMVKNDIALITSIGIDHEAWLGSDREKIAVEKAGIINKNGRVVCSDTDIPISIFNIARKKRATLVANKRDYNIVEIENQLCWHSAHPLVPRQWRTLSGIRLPLQGEHQIINLGGVIATLALSSMELGIDTIDLETGLANSSLSARCQIIGEQPLLIIDVAHNQDSAQELAKLLETQPRNGKSFAVFGVLNDKALDRIITSLKTSFDCWILATLDVDRGQTSNELGAKLANSIGQSAMILCDSPVQAYQEAVNLADTDDRIVIFGSFHTVGDIMGFIESNGKVH